MMVVKTLLSVLLCTHCTVVALTSAWSEGGHEVDDDDDDYNVVGELMTSRSRANSTLTGAYLRRLAALPDANTHSQVKSSGI